MRCYGESRVIDWSCQPGLSIESLERSAPLIPSFLSNLVMERPRFTCSYYAISSRASRISSSLQPDVPHTSSSPLSELQQWKPPQFSGFVLYHGALANAEVAGLTNGSQLLARFHQWVTGPRGLMDCLSVLPRSSEPAILRYGRRGTTGGYRRTGPVPWRAFACILRIPVRYWEDQLKHAETPVLEGTRTKYILSHQLCSTKLRNIRCASSSNLIGQPSPHLLPPSCDYHLFDIPQTWGLPGEQTGLAGTVDQRVAASLH